LNREPNADVGDWLPGHYQTAHEKRHRDKNYDDWQSSAQLLVVFRTHGLLLMVPGGRPRLEGHYVQQCKRRQLNISIGDTMVCTDTIVH
jgi:hypothetical protein